MSNQLKNETSPYLQQHANNPVDWYPWSEEALTLARIQNKPILLSIGYTACHWCHVMAHESFEDPETAALMNQFFINIKIDREERPDLDKVYQSTHYLLTQQPGGWPLTVFLSPDLTPYFSGTYYPRESRYQLPAFKDVLQTLANIYYQRPNEVQLQNRELIKVIQTPIPELDSNIKLDKKPLELVDVSLSQIYDKEFGGFGGAPKFPRPTVLEFLLRHKSPMALKTLEEMAKGGINDQLAGGFFRYSVDKKWEIPHFEKMLYDNAQLLYLYSLAAKQTQNPLFIQTARETAEWVLAKMEAPEGGYFSSLDADSEGHEGKFYVWNKFEIDELLSEGEALVASLYFGLNEAPNFEKKWHLHVANDLETVAKKCQISVEKAHKILASIKQKLLSEREKRLHPFCDTKILTSWNALMIKGMAVAGDVLQEPRFTASAEKALDFIQQKLWIKDQLFASYKDGKNKFSAYLDDYAFLLDALMTMSKISYHKKYLDFAEKLAHNMISHFQDKDAGGFFFTADNQEKVLYRPKTFTDETFPSGNGAAVRALLILSQFVNEPNYFAIAEKTLKAAWLSIIEMPSEHCSLLLGLKEFLEPPQCTDPGCGL